LLRWGSEVAKAASFDQDSDVHYKRALAALAYGALHRLAEADGFTSAATASPSSLYDYVIDRSPTWADWATEEPRRDAAPEREHREPERVPAPEGRHNVPQRAPIRRRTAAELAERGVTTTTPPHLYEEASWRHAAAAPTTQASSVPATSSSSASATPAAALPSGEARRSQATIQRRLPAAPPMQRPPVAASEATRAALSLIPSRGTKRKLSLLSLRWPSLLPQRPEDFALKKVPKPPPKVPKPPVVAPPPHIAAKAKSEPTVTPSKPRFATKSTGGKPPGPGTVLEEERPSEDEAPE